MKDRCRCEACSKAQHLAQKRRRVYGTNAYVDAAPTREHLLDLLAHDGVTYASIGALLGQHPTYLATIGRGERPHVQTSTQRSITAVRVEDVTRAKSVDAASATLRLQSLVCLGWSFSRLSRESGIDTNTIAPIIRGEVERISTRTDDLAAMAYEKLWNHPPTVRTPAEKTGITRSRSLARSNGWRMPLDIEDDLRVLDAIKRRAIPRTVST